MWGLFAEDGGVGAGGMIGIIVALISAAGAGYTLLAKFRADRRAESAEDRKAQAESAKAEADRIRLEIDARVAQQSRIYELAAEKAQALHADYLQTRDERSAYKARCEWQERRISELTALVAALEQRLEACAGCPPKGGP